MTQHQLVWVGRWAILIFAAIAYLMSVFIPGLLVTIGLVALSGTAQVIVPTPGVLFWRRANAQGATAGLLTGIAIPFCDYIHSKSHGTLLAAFRSGGANC